MTEWLGGPDGARSRSLGTDPAQTGLRSGGNRCQTLEGFAQLSLAIRPVRGDLKDRRVYGAQIPSTLHRDRSARRSVLMALLVGRTGNHLDSPA